MRTRTIYNAHRRFMRNQGWTDNPRWMRQGDKFRAELLRRMDERDALVAPRLSAFASVERIGQYMAALSDDIKADDILRGGK